jgi:hypothetical protein
MLRELPDLSVDFTSAAWSIVRQGIVLATLVLSLGPFEVLSGSTSAQMQGAVAPGWHRYLKRLQRRRWALVGPPEGRSANRPILRCISLQ